MSDTARTAARKIPPMAMGAAPARDRVTVAGSTPATMSAAELRREIVAEGRRWRHCLGRLKAADAWFRAHRPRDPDWPAAVRHARALTGAAYRCRVAGGNALLGYAARVRAMPAADRAFEADIMGVTATDAAALWRSFFPCPHACDRLAFELSGWSPWWDVTLPEPVDCGECDAACVPLIPADRAAQDAGVGGEEVGDADAR